MDIGVLIVKGVDSEVTQSSNTNCRTFGKFLTEGIINAREAFRALSDAWFVH